MNYQDILAASAMSIMPPKELRTSFSEATVSIPVDSLQPVSEDNIYSLGCKLLANELNLMNNGPSFERKYLSNKILNQIKEQSSPEKLWEFSYSPFFSPIEIEELSGYYSDEVDESSNELFREYYNCFYGYKNNFNITTWVNEATKYDHLLQHPEYLTEDRIGFIKQNLIRIGWNPEIPFNTISQRSASIRLESLLQDEVRNISIVDLTSSTLNESESITESHRKQLLKPISIVLMQGAGPLSPVIGKFTNSDFSHSAICIDNDFSKLYSFNADNKFNKNGGFSIENIDDLRKNAPDHRIAIFTFFITPEKWERINKNVQELTFGVKNTTYSFVNILLLPFKDVNFNASDSMICSQFVDRMLKLADIDISNIDSSKVTPAHLYNSSIKNSKVYKVFDGPVKDFNNNKVSRFINSFSKRVRAYGEAGLLYEYCIGQTTYPVVTESIKIPIEFTKDGDLLLKNPFVDFDSEYFNTHKLLLQYYECNDIEGMKYELARLYYMNYLLEKQIYSNKNLKNKEKNKVTRARILNDFNKYLAYIIKQDPKFNFAEYYEQSPFSHKTIEVKKSTIQGIKNILF